MKLSYCSYLKPRSSRREIQGYIICRVLLQVEQCRSYTSLLQWGSIGSTGGGCRAQGLSLHPTPYKLRIAGGIAWFPQVGSRGRLTKLGCLCGRKHQELEKLKMESICPMYSIHFRRTGGSETKCLKLACSQI